MTEPAHRPLVLLVSPLPPPPGGIATWTQALLRSSAAESVDLAVLDTASREKSTVRAESRLRAGRAWHAIVLLARFLGRIFFSRPDVVHINTSYFWAFVRDGLFVWLAWAGRCKVVLHFRGGDFEGFVSGCPPLLQGAIRRTLLRTDLLIALTGETERFLRAFVPRAPVHYLPNFVDVDEIRPRAESAREPGGDVSVLFVGWIIGAKGVEELLDATAAVPGVRLDLVGPVDPDFGRRIAPKLEALGDRCRRHGPLDRAAVLRRYEAADVFVLPTYREGFPNVVLEAMAAGLPVGAIPDVVRDGREGLLVPPRDEGALERALRRLVDDPALCSRLGRSARRRAEEEFGIEVVALRIARVYEELACGLPPVPAEGPASS